jgi:hypothetical protein
MKVGASQKQMVDRFDLLQAKRPRVLGSQSTGTMTSSRRERGRLSGSVMDTIEIGKTLIFMGVWMYGVISLDLAPPSRYTKYLFKYAMNNI